MRRMLAVAVGVLFLLLFPLACSDDPEIAAPEDLRIEIVRGDRQSAPVRPAAAPSAALVALDMPLPGNLLPEPLVARITVVGEGPRGGLVGPAFDVLPQDIAVTFRVVQPVGDPHGRDCGASFLDSAIPDDSAHVTTYWERGTLAGVECRMEVRLVVDGVPRVDTAFVAVFEPGPVAGVYVVDPPPELVAGDSLWIPDVLTGGWDAHQNTIPLADLPEQSGVTWAWRPIRSTDPVEPQGSGWATRVPAEAAGWTGLYCPPGGGPCTGANASLRLWRNGVMIGGVPLVVR